MLLCLFVFGLAAAHPGTTTAPNLFFFGATVSATVARRPLSDFRRPVVLVVFFFLALGTSEARRSVTASLQHSSSPLLHVNNILQLTSV